MNRSGHENDFESEDSVLLIEDEQELREIFAEVLSQSGYFVTACGSLKEARAHVTNARFSILVTDWQLGTESADSLLLDREYQNILPGTILVITAYSDTHQFPNELTSRFHILEKPFPLDHLPRKLQEITSGRLGF